MKEAKVFLTKEAVQKALARLAREIDEEFQNKAPPLVLVAPLKGAVFFAADLIRHISVPTAADFISIAGSSGDGPGPERPGGAEGGGEFHIIKDISAPIRGRHVLIVKDILNTGRKMLFLKKRLLAGEPASVKIAVLLDKAARRSVDLRPDFRGFSIDDRYVFGCGMDHEGKYRCLRDIYHFTQ